MGTGFYPELLKKLLEAGCVFVRHGKGSHEVWHSPLTRRNFSVPRSTNSRHTANKVLQDAGLPKGF